MKRITMFAALLLAVTMLAACSKPHVPPADYSEPETELTETQETARISETTAASASAETTTAAPDAHADETGTSTEASQETTETSAVSANTHRPSVVAWADAYEKLLRKKNRESEHVDAYFALIRLDPDKVPELCILDDVYMELYTFQDGETELLMEDAYKSSAVAEQNVCYQPILGKFASYFSTMGGGTGYNIYVYEQLDTLHVTRYCFNNNEDEGGEMPYNAIWDSAEEFGISNNGWNDVTLGGDWISIDEDFEALYELADTDADTLREYWSSILEED